jgi:type II secretory pathway pseudopilin PulG
MFSPLSFLKPLLYLVIVLVIAGGLYYVTNIKADLAISEANNQKLIDATKAQNELIEQMQKDITLIQETNKQLAEQNEKQKQDVATLSSKFSKRDFGALAAEKPAVVEKLINRGTTNVMRCLELASGAPLNEKEKAAKTPTEANRECPSLIDNDYKAPM